VTERIPDARLVELDGDDHAMWLGEVDLLPGEIECFLTGQRSMPEPDWVLATIVAAAYDPERYDRLVAIKRRYDPENVFRLNQNVGPRLRATAVGRAARTRARPPCVWAAGERLVALPGSLDGGRINPPS
jgi:hypothetical protein